MKNNDLSNWLDQKAHLGHLYPCWVHQYSSVKYIYIAGELLVSFIMTHLKAKPLTWK